MLFMPGRKREKVTRIQTEIKMNNHYESFEKSPKMTYKTDVVLVLTISLAGVIDSGEVLVAATLVGAFGVVADVGTHSELQTLVLI